MSLLFPSLVSRGIHSDLGKQAALSSVLPACLQSSASRLGCQGDVGSNPDSATHWPWGLEKVP